MTLAELHAAVASRTPPPSTSPPLVRALWFDAIDDWERAHAVAQDVHTRDGSWLHAYLHRKEGDLANAGYWYRRAGRPVERGPLDEEWLTLATAFTSA
jgi:hypothetical protein